MLRQLSTLRCRTHIPAFHSYDSSKEQTLTSPGLNNATNRFHSCLPADYILLFYAWGTPLDLKGQTEILLLVFTHVISRHVFQRKQKEAFA